MVYSDDLWPNGPFPPVLYDFYAISGVLTVPVPEPNSILLAAFRLTGLMSFGWRRRNRVRSADHRREEKVPRRGKGPWNL